MANISTKDISHIVKFDGTNFPSWKYGVWLLLEKYQLIPIVEGKEKKPTEVN